MPGYNLLRALKLKGQVDKPALAQAFADLIARHEILRTGLIERDGTVLQRVQARVEFVLDEQDLGALPAPQRDREVEALAMRICHMPFDLALPPHLRASLVRLADAEHLLLIVFHHAIIDGSSMGTFFDDLAALYDARRSGGAAVLPELAFQYSEFVERQERRYTRTAERDIAFWKKTLAGAPPLLALPTARPRSHANGCQGRRIAFEIERPLAEALTALCVRHGATLFMGLLSAFQILLQRWADTDDVVIGTPVSGSRDEDLAPLVGCFVNTLALRGDLSGDPTFITLLARNRSSALDAFEHQQLPFERVVAEMTASRTRDHAPIFQTMFVLQNFRHDVPRFAGIATEEVEADPGVAALDLTLEIVEGDELACFLTYDSGLFDRGMMLRMASQFRLILEAVVAAPERAIRGIELLDKDEWLRAVFDWNSTARVYGERTPAEVFAAVAAARPGDVALVSDGARVSFAELAALAGQVATALRRDAAGSTEPVGIFLPRSVDAFAAILGCLVAGVPWVPLDTAQPDRRLAQLLDLAGCRSVLTLRALSGRLPEHVVSIAMDEDAPLWSEPAAAIEAATRAELAYVLFTSGSTGTPKGVMGSTRALMNRIDWMHEAYPFARGEVACCKTSIGFVDSVWEMLGPLLAGIPDVIVPDEAVIDPEAFIKLLREHGVTRIVLVPTLLRVLLDHAPDLGKRLPALAMWSVSGEALAPDLVKRFRLACPGCRLVNLYGSSEVAADVLVHEIEEMDVDGPVPIGKPLANTQVYILDRAGHVAPVGLPGAIHVGGACLALGYWNKPDLTAERFRANPIPGTPSPLLFDTGDRGVWRADGSILYLGRTDGQVKLRGVRLELGEVLTALRGHPAVKDAAAVIVGEADNQRLVAFVVGHQGRTAPVAAELRGYLRERLPAAAVPAKLHVVEALPLLPSGKVDQVALRSLADGPARGEAESGIAKSSMAAVNADVAQIWCAVLEEQDIGAADDFFSLGGNSLLAMQVIVRVRRRFGIDIPIRALFDNPTLAGFSAAVEASPAAEDDGLTEIRPRARPAELGELRQRLAQLSPDELDALLRSLKQET